MKTTTLTTVPPVSSPADIGGPTFLSANSSGADIPVCHSDVNVMNDNVHLPSRRGILQALGTGLLIAVGTNGLRAQEAPRRGRGGRGGGGGFGGSGARTVSARVHIGADGSITVMTGKVEAGQGARAEITSAAAEELRVSPDRVQLIMADTQLVPDDGITAGSGTTPRTIPAVRQGCAAARQLLVAQAAKQWGVDAEKLQVREGKITDPASGKEITYAQLAGDPSAAKLLDQVPPQGVTVTAVTEWKTLGTPQSRPNAKDLVTGRHHFPSDIIRPGMLRAKVLRPPSYGAKLTSIDLEPAKAMKDVVVAQEGGFVGVAAPTSYAAEQALEAISGTAKWETTPQPSSSELYEYLRQNAQVPANPFADVVSSAAKKLKQTYHVAYIQHTPMEPRTAVAEWEGEKLTVWCGTQNPFGVRSELARAFNIPAEQVRVIVPDFGGGFGGKHNEVGAVEAARLAKAAGKPVWLRYTRAEEFTWAYFRPAGVIDMEASLDDKGMLSSWMQVNINSGPNAIESPYRCAKSKTQFVGSKPPLRHGSYRGLAATANTFAREAFIDEMAALAGANPLEFRLAHLDHPRLRPVLEEVAKKFDWSSRSKVMRNGTGVGIACGTEKGSYVAACAEVTVARDGKIAVKHVCQAYECGAILNPSNLLQQVQGAIIMGIGPALREEMTFKNGAITNASFWKYLVPRFEDVPSLDIHLMNRPDLPSAGAGETPIIAIAPAIANAVYHATGVRVRSMPMKVGTT
jgi:CO/xanthine dehydrogenase Mo-binding subunit